MDWIKARAPGLLLALAVAVPARLASPFLPRAIGEVVVALLLGAVIANVVGLPARAKPGVQVAVKQLLRIGIALLGARLVLGDIVAIGAPAALIVVVLMTTALAAAVGLGRALRLPTKLCVLLGVGTAVCGNSAIAAAAPVIEAEERDVAFAVATITLFGTLATIVYPIVGAALAFAPATYGAWVGLAVNDTSQVVAAGTAGGAEALDVAMVVKLTRNALMAPLLVGLALVMARARAAASGGAGALGARALLATAASAVPLFVLAFLALSLLRTAAIIDAEAAALFEKAGRLLVLVALAGVGLSTRFADLRSTGLRPLALGLVLSTALSGAALFALSRWDLVGSR